MKFGISVYNLPIGDVVEVAVAADRAGFDSLWLGEHVVLPGVLSSIHPTYGNAETLPPVLDPDTHLVDPWVCIGAIGAVTTNIEVATGVYVLPLHNPLLTARAAATAQELLGGRLRMGFGAGWLEDEFDALHVPFKGRFTRMEEAISLLRAAWAGGPFTHEGANYACAGVQVRPGPVAIPIVLGGNTDNALRRAARLGDGWFNAGTLPLELARERRSALMRFRQVVRPDERIETYVKASWTDRVELDGFAEAGFDAMVFRARELVPFGGAPGYSDAVRAAGAVLGLAERAGHPG